MHTTLRQPARPPAVAAPAAAALVTLLAVLVALFAGRLGDDPAENLSSPASPTSAASMSGAPVASIPVSGDRALRIELVVGDEIATATLHDTPEAREFAAMLPVSVDMEDPFGQAKTGQLPRELDVEDAIRSRSYAAGDLSYWPPSGKLAIVYDALGESVPPPGLVRLGTVDTELDALTSAGDDFTMTIRRAR